MTKSPSDKKEQGSENHSHFHVNSPIKEDLTTIGGGCPALLCPEQENIDQLHWNKGETQ